MQKIFNDPESYLRMVQVMYGVTASGSYFCILSRVVCHVFKSYSVTLADILPWGQLCLQALVYGESSLMTELRYLGLTKQVNFLTQCNSIHRNNIVSLS